MCKKLIYLVSVVLVLALMSGSPCTAATLLLYDFGDGSGTTVTDLSGNGNHGTLVGFTNTAAGGGVFDSSEGWVTGGGLCFIDNSVRSYVETPFNLSALPGDFTLEFMANYAGSSGWTPMFGSNASGCCAAAIFFGINSNLTNAEVRLQDSGGPVGLHPWSSPPDLTVHHLALVYDAATKSVEVFADGTSIGTATRSAANMAGATTQFRIGNTGWSSGEQWDGILFGIAISDVKLNPDSYALLTAPVLPTASDPNPADGATDVPRDVTLSWSPGDFANKHDVYFGTNFDDVTGGIGGVRQTASNYTPPQRLDFETTYYWRVDEVNAPPSSAVHKGDVWSFTTEPVAYPIAGASITATASSNDSGKEPENTVNGSGLDASGLLHGNAGNTMWLSSRTATQPTWIEFEFDRVYKLHEMWVWNSNETLELAIGFGIKEATIAYSVNGSDWTALGTPHEFVRAPGLVDYAHNTTVDFGGAAAKYVRLTANSNWGGLVSQYGLSEIRFFYIPVRAREPLPESGAADVDPGVTLAWRAGREAATHNVYVSDNEQAVIDGSAPAAMLTDASYSSAFDLGMSYYWRVDEVNDAETPTTWQGDVWDFTTQEFIVVDDFESYNDIPDGEEGSNLVYVAWVDGFGNPSANGSTIGYVSGTSLERDNVHGGKQSVPLFYSNTGGATFSEAVRTFTAPQDWTRHGISTLGLWFRGAAGNTGQLYVKINGTKVTFNGDAGALLRGLWTLWKIDLAGVGVNLQSVATLSIGIDGAAAAGVVYIDDVALYREAPQGPQDPGTENLVAYYAMENNAQDGSGTGNNGVLVGGAQFAQDAYRGTVLSVDGVDDVMEVPHSASIGFNDATNLTVTLWLQPAQLPRASWTSIIAKNRDVSAGDAYGIWISTSNDWHFRVGSTSGNANLPAAPDATEGWHFVAMAHDADATTLRGYLDGRMIYENTSSNPAPLTAVSPLWIGGAQGMTEYYPGLLDEVRIYNRVLSDAEMSFVGAQ